MNGFLFFLVALVGAFVIFQWRMGAAAKRLQGLDLPAADFSLPTHPDGAILLFHHPRCGPCRDAMQQIELMEQAARSRVATIDISEQFDFTQACGVRATPTLLFVQNGKIIKAMIGPQSHKKLMALLGLH